MRKIFIFIYVNQVGKIFAYGPRDWRSMLGWVIPKTQKIVLDTSLLTTQHRMVRIKSKVEQTKERRSALSNTSA